MRDLAALTGLALVGTGLWWYFPPVALVVLGGLLLIGALSGWYRDGS